jgi:RimJ/RimL family protein N-acetyltransferase
MSVNHLLIEVPDWIETERLTLRVPRAGDGRMVFASVRDSLEELKPWMPWARDDYSVESSEEWCRRSAADFIERKGLNFLMLLKNGEHVGNLGTAALDWDVPKVEIGYWLRTSHCGKGLVTEAVDAVCNVYLKSLKFERIEIRADELNERSWRVAERCGFVLEGTLRNDFRYPHGRLRSTRVYSKLRGA